MNTDLPFVSIICPVFNSASYIDSLVTSLLNQSYPSDLYEIILVDNGSTDNSTELISHYNVTLLHEPIPSSYAARNKGILHAKGSIFAFIDSDCIADQDWLKEGTLHILNKNDLVAGKVNFIFQNPKDPWEIFDSVFHMNQEKNVLNGCAATANLFVRSSVFEALHLFNSTVNSGEDRAWTSKALSKGFKLSFSPRACVNHPTRKRNEVAYKALRTGGGFVNAFKSSRSKFPIPALILVFLLRNLTPLPLPSEITRRGNLKIITCIKVFCVFYLVRNIRSLGLILSILGIKFR